jgi:hypothetical protein
MHTTGDANFWRRTSAAARPALLATLVVLVVGLASFVALVLAGRAYFGLSPLTLILTPPAPGAPSLWLGMVLVGVALQAAATLALRQRAVPLRVIGAVVAAAIAVVCLAFLASALFSLVDYVIAGNLPGDFADLLGILFFGVPVAVVIGGLNARAVLLEVRELFQ